MMQYGALNDTFYFHFAANDTSGSGNDGATPLCDVRECGATISDAPVYEPTPALLSNAAYMPGLYEVAIAATAGNGFSAAGVYAVFCSLTVDSQNPSGLVGYINLNPVAANAVQVSGDGSAADNLESAFDGTGYDVGGIDVSELNTAVDAIGSDGTGLTEAGGTGDQLTAVPWNSAWDAEVQSEVTDGLNAYDPPTYTELLNLIRVMARSDAAVAADLSAVLTAINTDLGSGAGDYDNTADALEAISDAGGGGPTAGQIADAVWDEATAGHTTAGTFGEQAKTDIDAILADTADMQPKLGTISDLGSGATVGDNLSDIDTAVAAVPTATENADELLKRDWTSVTGEAARSVLNALRFLRNKWTISAGTLSVKEEDDTTEAWNAAVTDDATADPVTGVDPT